MSIEALEAKAVRAYHAQRESETELAAIEVKEFIQDVIGVQPEEVHDKNYLWRIGPYFFGYEKSGHKIKITVRKFCEHCNAHPVALPWDHNPVYIETLGDFGEYVLDMGQFKRCIICRHPQ